MSLGDLAKALSGSSVKGACNCGTKKTKYTQAKCC